MALRTAGYGGGLGESSAIVTTPTQLKRHARPHRGSLTVPSSEFETGRFGRMFRHLPVFQQDPAHLAALAERMVSGGRVDNPRIPAGYTYFGQFIDHDITFDPVSSLQRQNDPDALHNFRTPRFDLDSMYGRGPSDQPYMYEADGLHLMLGESVDENGDPASAGPDLPRNKPRTKPDGSADLSGRALIGDPRNDENVIVSQLHLTFLKFHNKVVDHVAATSPMTGDDLFKDAQRRVRWHYQWAVVHDFLEKIVGEDVLAPLLGGSALHMTLADGSIRAVEMHGPPLQHYRPRYGAYMPIEFAVAAYRFGHSMIRGRYRINEFVPVALPIFSPETPTPETELASLNGFRRLPPNWGIEWRFFFDVAGAGEEKQPAFMIDSSLAGPLGDLPPEIASDPSSLALRNLERGLRLGLPSGQAVAGALGVEPLSGSELGIDDIDPAFGDNAPLWFYILKESELKVNGGEHLGPVGAQIVAEVLIGLLAYDPLSYLSVQPGWMPEEPMAREDGTFDIARLIEFAIS